MRELTDRMKKKNFKHPEEECRLVVGMKWFDEKYK